MSTYILGVNAYHGDSSACILKDGRLLAALEEERIRRIKHWAGLPTGAIKFCLDFAGMGLEDVDYIAVAKDPLAHILNKFSYTLLNFPSPAVIVDRLRAFKKSGDMADDLAKEFGVSGNIKKKIKRVEHHKAHLASAFFVSPFDTATLVSVDGLGDFVSSMRGMGEGNKIKILDYTLFPHSLGFLYTALTQYLGFWKYGDEYKVMGLSAFGKPDVYLSKVENLLRLKKGGKFELNLKYFIHHKKHINLSWSGGAPSVGQMFSRELENLLGPARRENEPLNERFGNIAAALQFVYEQGFFHILNEVYEKTQNNNIVLAGGTIQNSLANGKIFDKTPFKKIYIPPAAYDAGNAVGAAYYLWNEILGKPRTFVMDSASWGPEYSDENIKSQISKIKNDGLRIEYSEEGQLLKKTAALLAQGKIVGWFQGRTEWGPRALGNRSILANPCLSEMKETLNVKIKKREPFRPFAPSILEEAVSEYFEESYPVPFMEKVYSIKPEKREVIPAVTHVDGTGRLQTVNYRNNSLYYKLIKEFGRLTGVPILLNTSFNENEPIVNRPEEAIDCFLRTKMDVLVLGHYMAVRNR